MFISCRNVNLFLKNLVNNRCILFGKNDFTEKCGDRREYDKCAIDEQI